MFFGVSPPKTHVFHRQLSAKCQETSAKMPYNRSTSATDAAYAYLPNDVEYKIFARNSTLVLTTSPRGRFRFPTFRGKIFQQFRKGEGFDLIIAGIVSVYTYK